MYGTQPACHSLFEEGLFLRLMYLVLIIRKIDRIPRLDISKKLGKRALIRKRGNPLANRHTKVMPAEGAYEKIFIEFPLVHVTVAGRTALLRVDDSSVVQIPFRHDYIP
jgi:hypothetical protein